MAQNRSYWQWLTLLGALMVVALVFGWAFTRSSSITSIAARIVRDCSTVPGDHAPCYESEVPALYPKLSVPDIFNVIRAIRVADPSYQFCHVLGHKVGERVVAEDPNGWVNAIPLNPSDGLCSNGFIHGVVGGRFRAEVLDDATIQKFLPDFTRACAAHDGWQPSDLDRAICYHGMGHLFDFITNANIPKALSLCRSITKDFERVCVQGVFMQIYQPLEPDDFALIAQMKDKPATSTVATYCAQYRSDPMAQGSCIEESWPLKQPHIIDGTAVESLCSLEPNAEESHVCYVAMASIVGRIQLGNEDRVVTACNAFPTAERETCFAGSAEAVLEESRSDGSKAIQLCNRASGEIAHACVAELVDHARFVFGGDMSRLHAFCGAVPADEQAACERGR